MGIATDLETGINGLLSGYVTAKSAAVCTAITPIAATGLTIYLLLLGYNVMMSQTTVINVALKKFSKIALVLGISLSAGTYQSIVIDFYEGLQSGLSTAVSGSPSIGTAIDNMATPFIQLKDYLFTEASSIVPDLSLLTAAIIVAIAHAAVVVTALGFFIVAKILFAVVLAVGPFFLLTAMFPVTQRIMESWASQVLNVVILQVIVLAFISMQTTMLTSYASYVNTNIATLDVIEATGSLLIISIALCWVIVKADSLSAALTGGISVGKLGALDTSVGFYDRFLGGRNKPDKDNNNNAVKDQSKNRTNAIHESQPSHASNSSTSNFEPIYRRSLRNLQRKAA